MPKQLRKSTECLNCHEMIHDSNYCSNCGQINTNKQVPLKLFIHDFLGDYFTFDSKFIKSFFPLFTQPGYLTNQYNRGKRQSYILPLRLYFFTTIMFFIVLAIDGKLRNSDNYEDKVAEVTPLELDSILTTETDLSVESKHMFISKMSRKYKLKPYDTKETHIPDSLSKWIIHSQPAVSSMEARFLAENLYSRFNYSKKKKRDTSSDVIKEYKSVLSQYNILSNASADSVLNSVKSRYRVKKRSAYAQKDIVYHGDSSEVYYRLKKGANFTVFNAPADSLEDGMIKSFVKKAELISKLDEGSFWEEVTNQIPKVMFLILPLFALILKFIYVRKGIFYINHLIFSLHAHTIFFLYLLVPLLISHWTTVLFCIFGIFIHLFLSLRNVYKQNWLYTLLKMCLLLGLYTIPLIFGFATLMILAVISI